MLFAQVYGDDIIASAALRQLFVRDFGFRTRSAAATALRWHCRAHGHTVNYCLEICSLRFGCSKHIVYVARVPPRLGEAVQAAEQHLHNAAVLYWLPDLWSDPGSSWRNS
eukprot:6174902-Pleurochrysis_carterae.AAC.3